MAHNWSKCHCKNCDKVKSVEQDGIEVNVRCAVDGKELTFWGDEECPLRRLIETENYQMS